MLHNDMDDDAWFQEAEKQVAREKAAKAMISDLDKKTEPQQSPPQGRPAMSPVGTPPQQAGNAGAYIPQSWATKSRPVQEATGRSQGQDMMSSVPSCGFDLTPPTQRSFDLFFKQWFVDVHFPVMSDLLKRELVGRARQKGFFSGLSSQVKKWAMANTDPRLQSDMWYSYFTKGAAPEFTSTFCFSTATVNLGAKSDPCMVTFYGYPDSEGGNWFLMPWSNHQAEMGPILDELDSQGGMSALAAAAADVAMAGSADDEDEPDAGAPADGRGGRP